LFFEEIRIICGAFMIVKNILLVDDSQPFNFLSRVTLESYINGCLVHEALNGKTALDYLAHAGKCPEVILLDINMPVMDGFEFLNEFEKKSKCKAVSKIFMLTSSMREEDKLASLRNKLVVGYFEKPLSESHIKEILASFSST
jgi:CheY-like chemotaxis protein